MLFSPERDSTENLHQLEQSNIATNSAVAQSTPKSGARTDIANQMKRGNSQCAIERPSISTSSTNSNSKMGKFSESVLNQKKKSS